MPEYSTTWTVVRRDGRRFWLTTNHGNPAEEFAHKICELTGLAVTET